MNLRVKTLKSKYGEDWFSKIGKLGFTATCNKWFNGDREAMKRWLVRMGQWSIDQGLSCCKPDLYRYPGPHPAEAASMQQWLDHAEENMGEASTIAGKLPNIP